MADSPKDLSVSGEYDLKHLAKGVVLNHASLLFSHSVERGPSEYLKFQVPRIWYKWIQKAPQNESLDLAGTLIFRHTHLEGASELGINCVAEAGARLLKDGQLLSGQAGLGDRDF